MLPLNQPAADPENIVQLRNARFLSSYCEVGTCLYYIDFKSIYNIAKSIPLVFYIVSTRYE